MNMDIERYLNNSRKVDLTGVDYASARRFPVTRHEFGCQVYVMDVESHTIVYLRELLNTCAIDDPEIAAFLSC